MTPVVRRHEHVAGARPGAYERRKCVAFEISGEQHAPARGFDRQDEARFVVSRPRRRRPGSWLERSHTAERIERERIAGREGADRDPACAEPREQVGHGRRVGVEEESLRHHDDPHSEATEQFGHRVEVVGVGMGEDEHVDPAHALAPQHTSERPPRSTGRAQTTGIVEQAPSRRRPHDDAAPVADVGDHDPQAPRITIGKPPDGCPDNAHHAPSDHERGPRATASQHVWAEQHDGCRERHVPARHPPRGRPRQPGMAQRNRRPEIHEPPDPSERQVAAGAAPPGCGPPQGRDEQTQKTRPHREGYQRCDENVEHESDRADDVEPRGDDRGRGSPDGQPTHEQHPRLPGARPHAALQRRSAAVNEPVDRIGRHARPRQCRGHPDEHGSGQKRQLRPRAEDLGWTPGEDHDRRDGQPVDRGRAAARRGRQAAEPDEERGPDDRRFRAHEQRVGGRAEPHRRQCRVPGHGQRAKRGEQRGRDEPHMQTRDREHVDGARDEKVVRLLAGQRLPRPEQQRRREPRTLGRYSGAQSHLAGGPQAREQGRGRPYRRPRERSQTCRGVDPHDRQDPPRA